MFDHLVKANDLLYEFVKYKFEEKDLAFIKEQIAGPRECAAKKASFVAFNDLLSTWHLSKSR